MVIKIRNLLLLTLLKAVSVQAQFDGAAGTIGSNAIYKDSAIFINWANKCILKRGLQHIADTSLGLATVGDSLSAVGKAGLNGVVSLGDKGIAILTFPYPIKNGPGFDFAVFENAFTDSFLELATVEVSSNGIQFFGFVPTSNTQTNSQIGPFQNQGNPKLLNNLAGKHKALYGTPFNLDEIVANVNLDINAITHIKITDVCGSINPKYSTFDVFNNPINDPFPTPFPSSGFDLDAVGVIHQNEKANLKNITFPLTIYPNPASKLVYVPNLPINTPILIYNLQGKILFNTKSNPISVQQLQAGTYMLKLQNQSNKSILFSKI